MTGLLPRAEPVPRLCNTTPLCLLGALALAPLDAYALAAGDSSGDWLRSPTLVHLASGVLVLLALALVWLRARYAARLRLETRGRLAADEGLHRVSGALRVLIESNQAVLRGADERSVLDAVCRVIVGTEGFGLAWVGYVPEGPGEPPIPMALAGDHQGYLDAVAAGGAADTAVWWPGAAALRSGRPVVVSDTGADPTFAPWSEAALRRGYGSVVGLPLVAADRAFGFLAIYATERDAFDPQTLGPLTELASNLACGIEALRARAEQRRTERRLWVSNLKQAMLNRVLQLAFEAMPLQHQLERVLKEVLSVPWLPLGSSGAICLSSQVVASGAVRVQHNACDDFRLAIEDLVGSGARAAGLGLGGEGARIACAVCVGGDRPLLPFCWVPIRSGSRLLGVLAVTLAADFDRVPDLGPEHDFLTALAGTLATLIERKAAEEQLRLFATVFESAAEGIMVTDARNRIVAVNDAFCAITGYRREEVVSQTPRFLRSDRHDDAFYASIWEAIGRDGRWQGEIWNRRKSGEVYSEWLSITVIRDPHGAVDHYLGVFTDISMLKQSQARLEYLAHHDGLTGLPNRLLFGARLEHAVQRANRERQSVGLLFLDLDRFKAVNDSLGHLVGDQLLQAVAERLRLCVREQDTVARLAGDEFVIILEALADPGAAAVVARKVLGAMAMPFPLAGQEIRIGASIGISLYPGDARDLGLLVRCADSAMYRAKESGRNTCAFYRPQPELERRAEPPRRLAT